MVSPAKLFGRIWTGTHILSVFESHLFPKPFLICFCILLFFFVFVGCGVCFSGFREAFCFFLPFVLCFCEIPFESVFFRVHSFVLSVFFFSEEK